MELILEKSTWNVVAKDWYATNLNIDEGGTKERLNKSSIEAKTQAAAEQEHTIRNIRVGVIREVKKHPDAESLYVETIDVGEE
nr:methionine--tRNA ligase [Tanacetum cinerariifolium]